MALGHSSLRRLKLPKRHLHGRIASVHTFYSSALLCIIMNFQCEVQHITKPLRQNIREYCTIATNDYGLLLAFLRIITSCVTTLTKSAHDEFLGLLNAKRESLQNNEKSQSLFTEFRALHYLKTGRHCHNWCQRCLEQPFQHRTLYEQRTGMEGKVIWLYMEKTQDDRNI